MYRHMHVCGTYLHVILLIKYWALQLSSYFIHISTPTPHPHFTPTPPGTPCAEFDLDALLAGPVPPAKSKVTLQLPRGQPDTSSKQLHAPSSSGLVGLASSDSLLKNSQKRPSSLHCTATPSEPSGPPPVAIVLHKLESNESMHPAPSHTSLSSCSKEAEGGKEEEEVGGNATGAAAKKYLGSSTTGWRPLPRAVVRDTPLEVSGSGQWKLLCGRRVRDERRTT